MIDFIWGLGAGVWICVAWKSIALRRRRRRASEAFDVAMAKHWKGYNPFS